MRNFGAIRPSCGFNMIPALGLLISFEGSSQCECSFNFQTSLAFAPTQHRSHEDWAVYNDWHGHGRGRHVTPVGAVIRHAHVNLGAPGDRRDDQEALWLGYPRKDNLARGRPRRLDLALAMDAGGADQFAPYRFNVDRRTILGTDRPWLYGSGYRDIRRIDLSLQHFDPANHAMALPAGEPPVIDGKLDDACWKDGHAIHLPRQNAVALLRYDEENLYIAYDRRVTFGGDGKPVALRMEHREHGAPVWEDDCMEVYFANRDFRNRGGRMLHFAVSAAGVRYEGLVPAFGADAPGRPREWSDLVRGEDAAWEAGWRSAARADENSFTVEVAIPWEVLESEGIEKDTMLVHFQPRQSGADTAESLAHELQLVDTVVEEKDYTVRLHFAEIDDAGPGERVFGIAIQGRTVLEGLDIRTEAGAPDTALVREFRGIRAGRSIRVEFSPSNGAAGQRAVPLLSAIEVVAED